MVRPMLYFLFLPDVWEAFPSVLTLVTNMGTVGTNRHQSVNVNMIILLGMRLLEEIFRYPIVDSPEMTC